MDLSEERFGLSLIAAFGRSSNASEFCKQLVHKVLRELGAIGAVIALVGQDSKCRAVGRYGEWEIGNQDVFNLRLSSPASAVIRTGKVLIIEDVSNLIESFPELDAELPESKSYLYSPFELTGRAVGFLAVAFDTKLTPRSLSESQIQMITLVAEYLATSRRYFGAPATEGAGDFSNGVEMSTHVSARQVEILECIASGDTNAAIGKKINLSESSIKQETVKIFRLLGVSNREQAVRVARETGLI
jgi:DNA-binding CsgD family transcriptional regulator